MITVRMQGGLGNQMFIYAAGRAWALSNSTDLALDTINGGYGDNEAFGRSYKLAGFHIEASTVDADTVRTYNPSSRSFYWLRKINALLPLRHRSLILEPRQFDPCLPCARLRAGAYLAGYWQREEYFLPYSDIIRRELRPACPARGDIGALAKKMGEADSVFIHIRRKQYGYKLVPEYYQDALSIIRSKISHPRFFVFGDDTEWARQWLSLPGDTTYLDGSDSRNDIVDIWLMTQCRNAIIANSSFSWWGSWLRSPEPGSVVIAPTNWGYEGRAAEGWLTISNDVEKDPQYT
jgi:hypothetical protein